MKNPKIIIDIFVTIVDNYGDMGFACEFISALYHEYGEQYECIIWTDNVVAMAGFVSLSGIGEIEIGDISHFGKMRKSAIGVSILHASIPDLNLFAPCTLILRIDYLSLDPSWVGKNETQHILSTRDRQIIELIPSPLEGGAGLIKNSPPYTCSERIYLGDSTPSNLLLWYNSSPKNGELEIYKVRNSKPQKHVTIFAYSSTLDCIDWDSFPSDLMVYVFGSIESKNTNIVCLNFLTTHVFYDLLDTSEFAIIRGEVSWAHMIQGSVPFLWDMYRDLGGFPREQSEQFLSMISASPEYRLVHQILNGQKDGKITYGDMLGVLSHSGFKGIRIHNLIHSVQKHIDRSHNSI